MDEDGQRRMKSRRAGENRLCKSSQVENDDCM